MYLDYAEDQTERQRSMHMKDWTGKLNAFLQFNDRDILKNLGEVSKTVEERIALDEYNNFNKHRINNNRASDFEAFIENNYLKK